MMLFQKGSAFRVGLSSCPESGKVGICGHDHQGGVPRPGQGFVESFGFAFTGSRGISPCFLQHNCSY